jgi:glucokinase
LENDADAAALGEYWQGAGQGVDHLAVVTVGTGIGTAFVYHGELYRGLRGVHPEIGHQVLDPKGPLCYCGARGCWESLAAGPSIARLARKELSRERKINGADVSLILKLAGGNLAQVSGIHVTEAARMGDPTALRIVEQAATYLGLGLVNVILFFVPEVILLGGGVMKSYDLLKPTLDAVIARHSLMVPVLSP